MIDKGLPKGYKKLEFIETTGTQWIDTGFIPNQDSRIVCEFMWFEGNGIYGTRTTTSNNNFALRVINRAWQVGYNTVLGSTGIAADTQNWHIANQNKNLFYIDGVLGYTHKYVEFKAPKSISLGGINAENKFYYGSGRYRACQIYDNGVMVRDFIPCKNDRNEVGMYDMLNAVFYRNAGTGEFVAGEEKQLITDRKMGATYEHTDLNRVESAVLEISDILQNMGVSESLETKTDWKTPGNFTAAEWPVQSQMKRYLCNVEKIKNIFPNSISLPSSMERLTYSGANNIEKVLQIAFERISAIQKTYKYSGEFFAGEELI